ncbi:ATP-binding cassette domain-containing protein, partial [bacterium]|nr:ATP-binding cassette domain-containing protein [bacterium]
KENPITLQGLNDKITFEHVNFEYVENVPVLKDLSLTIGKNETLAIIGNSGGGKSTLVNLLPRFYDIKSGSIKFDGIDIRDFSISSLRHNISMVFQDNFLYSGTIRENILMGNPNASEEELQKAIEYAHLQEMVADLPNGLDTVLGERGTTLSGGQRQRVAIARAMIKNAPIVILDEATSALDNKSEAIVQKALDNLIKNKTVFVIAHRLSTIKNADRIAVINEGQLVELGNHDELIAIANGQYKTLYEMQFKKQEEASV